MKTKEITNSEDILDSRDIIARIEHLESELQSEYEMEIEESDETPEFEEWLTDQSSDEANELKALRDLAEEASGSPDWTYGETLIRDSYFEDYARQLAEDIGAIPDDAKWPCTCIDWEHAARELKYDYMSVSFDGVEYWIRA